MLLVSSCPLSPIAIKLCIAALNDKHNSCEVSILLVSISVLTEVVTAVQISSGSCSAAPTVGVYKGYAIAF
jgi:hypothetical protein